MNTRPPDGVIVGITVRIARNGLGGLRLCLKRKIPDKSLASTTARNECLYIPIDRNAIIDWGPAA